MAIKSREKNKMIDKNILSWLVTVPHSDIGFKSYLEEANIETIEEALKDKFVGKTKRIVLERKLRKLKKGVVTLKK